MKKLQTRSYQVLAVNHALKTRSRRLLLVAPGGAGKTAIITLLTQALVRKSKRVLIISHRIEIIQQTLAMLNGRVPTGQIIAGIKPDAAAPVQVASIDTLRSRQLPIADVVLVDEAHRAVSATYKRVLAHYLEKGAKLVGLTASPVRLDGVGMRVMFDTMYEVIKPSQLLGKYIMKPRVFSAKPEHLPNLAGIRSSRKEYSQVDLVQRVNKDGLVGGIVEHAKKHLGGRTAVAFCVSIKHSKHVARKLTAAGIPALHVDGGMSSHARADILRRLTVGEIQVVTCCMLLSEGWDLPSCEAVILARPTRSLSLFLQMCNRAVRMSERTPIILDHACNHLLHGYSYTDRTWSLDGEVPSSKKQDERVLVCAECYRVNEPEAEECEGCGAELVNEAKVQRLLAERKELELAELKDVELKARLNKVRAIAKTKGFSQTWVNQIAKAWSEERL